MSGIKHRLLRDAIKKILIFTHLLVIILIWPTGTLSQIKESSNFWNGVGTKEYVFNTRCSEKAFCNMTEALKKSSVCTECFCRRIRGVDVVACEELWPFSIKYFGKRHSLLLISRTDNATFNKTIQFSNDLFDSLNIDSIYFDCLADETTESNALLLNISIFNRNDKLKSIKFRNNGIVQILGSFVSSFPNLSELVLFNNSLSNVSAETFHGLNKLTSLSLLGNKLMHLKRYFFKSLISLTQLTLNENNISIIDEDAFKDLTDLRKLFLSANQISFLPSALFKNNRQLRYLILDHNNIKYVTAHIFFSLSNLQMFVISYNDLTELPSGFLDSMKHLRVLHLSNNNLVTIPDDLFKHNTEMSQISLAHNAFVKIPLIKREENFETLRDRTNLQTLNHVNFLHFYLSKILGLHINKLFVLDLSGNCFKEINERNPYIIPRVFRCRICCIVNVSLIFDSHILATDYIDLAYNKISTLNMTDLSMLKNWQFSLSINLSYNLIKTISIECGNLCIPNYKLGINSQFQETVIELNNNPIACDCHLLKFIRFINDDRPNEFQNLSIKFLVDRLICSEPSTLKGISVKRLSYFDLMCDVSSEKQCPKECHCNYRPYDDTLIVNCTHRNLTSFPLMSTIEKSVILHLEHNKITNFPQWNSSWLHVKELHLSFNYLKSLKHFKYSERLQKLYIDNNRLTRIESQLQTLLTQDDDIEIRLSGNPWNCNCEILDLKSMIFTTGYVSDANSLTCSNGIENRNRFNYLKNATEFLLCPSRIPKGAVVLKISVSLAVVVSIIIVSLIIIIHLRKEQIKFWLFIHRLCHKWVTEKDIDANKKYDAFVSYSANDEQWVAEELVPGLEQGNPPYKLCLHTRDWLGGEWIPEQIVRSVTESRRTIIILTDNFVQSEWSRLEFSVAYKQMTEDKIKRILIIVPNQLPDISSLNKELQLFISNNTYLLSNNQNFWLRLRCAMPRVQESIQN